MSVSSLKLIVWPQEVLEETFLIAGFCMPSEWCSSPHSSFFERTALQLPIWVSIMNTFMHEDITVSRNAPGQIIQLDSSTVKSLCQNISMPTHLGAKTFPCRNLHGAKSIPLLKHPNVFYQKKNNLL